MSLEPALGGRTPVPGTFQTRSSFTLFCSFTRFFSDSPQALPPLICKPCPVELLATADAAKSHSETKAKKWLVTAKAFSGLEVEEMAVGGCCGLRGEGLAQVLEETVVQGGKGGW